MKELALVHRRRVGAVSMVLVLAIGVQITTVIVNGLTDKTEQAIGTALPGVILILIASATSSHVHTRDLSVVLRQILAPKCRQGSDFGCRLTIRPLLITQSVNHRHPTHRPVCSTDWCSSTNPILGCGAS